jgi:hypothetical protein
LKRATTNFKLKSVKSPHYLLGLTMNPGLVGDVISSTDILLVQNEHLRVHKTVGPIVKSLQPLIVWLKIRPLVYQGSIF